MAKRRPDFELTLESAKKIVEMIGYDYDTYEPVSPPSEICKAFGIDRRTFNSIVSKAIFSKKPTEAQILIREHIMELIYGQVYMSEG